MPWIRFDTAILFDDFCNDLTGDEFKAWCFLLLYVKASGARGSAPDVSEKRLSAMSGVPAEAVRSMMKKAGDKFWVEKGRIHVKSWHKWQEDYRDKSASPRVSGDDNNTATPPHRDTTETETKELVTRKSAGNEKELTEKSFLLRPDEGEFAIWKARIASQVAKRGGFTWRPTTGSFESDLKSLAYKFPDERKRSLLWETYNMLHILNWLDYVELAVTVMLNASTRKPIHEPYKFTYSILNKPASLLAEKESGGLSETLKDLIGKDFQK